jgi:hypothetical protein
MPELFNVHGFEPPVPVTERSLGPWVDHGVSGHLPATSRHLKTRFRYGSAGVLLSLAADKYSPVHYAKGTPSHVSCDIVLRPLVSVWFQVLLTLLIAVLFTVQSPYLFTIGHRGIFSLSRWSA